MSELPQPEVVKVSHLAQVIEVVRWTSPDDAPTTRHANTGFVPRRMTPNDFVDGWGRWHPEGLASLARILRMAKERREQAVIGAAFDAARAVTP